MKCRASLQIGTIHPKNLTLRSRSQTSLIIRHILSTHRIQSALHIPTRQTLIKAENSRALRTSVINDAGI